MTSHDMIDGEEFVIFVLFLTPLWSCLVERNMLLLELLHDQLLLLFECRPDILHSKTVWVFQVDVRS